MAVSYAKDLMVANAGLSPDEAASIVKDIHSAIVKVATPDPAKESL
jgi:hypothetical protein